MELWYVFGHVRIHIAIYVQTDRRTVGEEATDKDSDAAAAECGSAGSRAAAETASTRAAGTARAHGHVSRRVNYCAAIQTSQSVRVISV